MRLFSRLWPSRSTVLVLGIAQVWGQIKLWLTLVVAWSGWSAWVQWAMGSLVAVVVTLVCYRMTQWAEVWMQRRE